MAIDRTLLAVAQADAATPQVVDLVAELVRVLLQHELDAAEPVADTGDIDGVSPE